MSESNAERVTDLSAYGGRLSTEDGRTTAANGKIAHTPSVTRMGSILCLKAQASSQYELE